MCPDEAPKRSIAVATRRFWQRSRGENDPAAARSIFLRWLLSTNHIVLQGFSPFLPFFGKRQQTRLSGLHLVLSLAILLSCQEQKPAPEAIKGPSTAVLAGQIDEYFSALRGLEKFNGVVFASKAEDVIIHKAYNLNPDEQSSTYVSPQSQFDIHSVSKLLARYLIEKLELAGKVKKSQTVSEFIADFPGGEKITLDLLLHHRSGLPRRLEGLEEAAINLSSEQIMDYAKKQELRFEPGTATQYSNIGYELVYYIIEQIVERPFAQYVAEEVFHPLGMNDSGAHFYARENQLKSLAKNHEREDSTIVQVDNILPDELKTARIFSTAADLNKFLNHLNEPPYAALLSDETKVIEKSGGSDGIRVQVYTHLERGYNFIFLANYEAVPFQQTVADFVKIMEHETYAIPQALNRKAIQVPGAILAQYVGNYTFADLGNLELTIEMEEEHLVVFQEGERIASLKAETENVFFEDPKAPESFEFVDDGEGRFKVLMGFKGVKLEGIKR
mgnify:CR=1 FL=1